MKKLLLVSVLFLALTTQLHAQGVVCENNICTPVEDRVTPTAAPTTASPQVPAAVVVPAAVNQPVQPAPANRINTEGAACYSTTAGGDREKVAALLSGECPANSISTYNGKPSPQNNLNLTYVPLEPIPGLIQTGNTDFGAFINALFKFIIILCGMIAVGAFVYAGIVYMTSDVVDSKSNARKRLTASLLGLLLLLGSWLILNTINPQLVRFSAVFNPAPDRFVTNPRAVCIDCHLTDEEKAAIKKVRDLGTNPNEGAPQTDVDTVRRVANREATTCLAERGGTVQHGMSCAPYRSTRSDPRVCFDIIGSDGGRARCLAPAQ